MCIYTFISVCAYACVRVCDCVWLHAWVRVWLHIMRKHTRINTTHCVTRTSIPLHTYTHTNVPESAKQLEQHVLVRTCRSVMAWTNIALLYIPHTHTHRHRSHRLTRNHTHICSRLCLFNTTRRNNSRFPFIRPILCIRKSGVYQESRHIIRTFAYNTAGSTLFLQVSFYQEYLLCIAKADIRP